MWIAAQIGGTELQLANLVTIFSGMLIVRSCLSPPLDPRIFCGDAHIPVKHGVFERYLPQNTCFGYIFDQVK